MLRNSWLVLTGILLVATVSGRAADDAPAGTWKMSILNEGKMTPFWIIKLEKKADQWSGTVAATNQGVPPGATIENLKLSGDLIHFDMRFQNRNFSFECKIPKPANSKMLGSLMLGRSMVPAQLEPTKATKFDEQEAYKDIVARGEPGPELFNAVLELARQATETKAKPEDVRVWANKGFTAAEPYGPRWQREMAIRLADTLVDQEGLTPLALEYARKAKRLIDPNEDFSTQLRVMNSLSAALKKSSKADEAKEVETEADQLYLKKMPPFKPEKFEGRKNPSERAVLVELFTGAQCPPCVAADLAFDAVEKTYKPSDVVLLQYHLHIPGPDPLTNEDALARSKYYDEEIEGTPTILFNGKLKQMTSGGGSVEGAQSKYQDYRKAIDSLLETTSPIKLKATAVRKGDKIEIVAEANDVAMPSDKLRLRLALVEEQVRYLAGNGLRFHHNVVRALPGGAAGIALNKKSVKEELTVELPKVRETLTKYLAEFGKGQQFPSDSRPLDLKNLSIVAFVQNDENKEVLQAVHVKIGE